MATMGRGVQMWLQVIWFLAREGSADCVILDEPDIYMHPDLQRRLIRLLRKGSGQVILTTHSPEILAEVDAEDVLVVDRSRSLSLVVSSLPGAQAVLTSLGSVHNLQLTRLWKARKFLSSRRERRPDSEAFSKCALPGLFRTSGYYPGFGDRGLVRLGTGRWQRDGHAARGR